MGAVAARTVGSAVRSAGDGALVLVSTPGRHAFVEAMDALDAGASVMVFSDNVPVEQEVALKRAADRAWAAGHGPRLRHRRHRRGRPRLRQRRAARAGGHRRRVRDRARST